MSRHARNDRCPFCHSSHFIVKEGFTKPEFICDTGCNRTWQSGYNGQPYLNFAKNFSDGQTCFDYVEYYWSGYTAGDGELKPCRRSKKV